MKRAVYLLALVVVGVAVLSVLTFQTCSRTRADLDLLRQDVRQLHAPTQPLDLGAHDSEGVRSSTSTPLPMSLSAEPASPTAMDEMLVRLVRIEESLATIDIPTTGTVPSGGELPGGLLVGTVLGDVVSTLGEPNCRVVRDQNGNTFLESDVLSMRYWFSPTTLQLVHAEPIPH